MGASCFSSRVKPNPASNTSLTSKNSTAPDSATAPTGGAVSAPGSSKIPVKSWSANTFKLRAKPINRRSPIRKVSKAQAKRLKEYARVRESYLSMHPFCECPKCRELNHIPIGGRMHFSTEIHHTRGRVGGLLCAREYFRAVCPQCHEWIGNNPAEARKLGMLCKFGDWGRQP